MSDTTGRNKRQQEELLTLARPNRLEEELGMQGVEGEWEHWQSKAAEAPWGRGREECFGKPEHVQRLRGKSQ